MRRAVAKIGIELSDTLVNSRQLVNNAVGSGPRTRLELEMVGRLVFECSCAAW